MNRLLTVTILGLGLTFPQAAPAFPTGQIAPEEFDRVLSTTIPGIRRIGPKLIITTGKSPVEFVDSEEAKYAVVGFCQHSMTRMDYFVFQGYSERHSFFLVNGETGAQVRLQGLPRVSPDRKRYLMASIGNGSGNVKNLLQILRAVDFSTEFKKEYPEDESVGPDSASWIDNSRIFFLEHGVEQPVPARAMLLELKEGKWVGPRETK